MTTKSDFVSHFATPNEAVEFENQVLSAGEEFLPTCARSVRDGGDATPEYWDFLISQIENR